MEVVRQVRPKLGMNPGLLIAPRWSMEPTVAAALQAKTEYLNSVFRCQCIVDLDDREGTGARTYQQGKQKKEAQGLSSSRCLTVWGFGKEGNAASARPDRADGQRAGRHSPCQPQ